MAFTPVPVRYDQKRGSTMLRAIYARCAKGTISSSSAMLAPDW